MSNTTRILSWLGGGGRKLYTSKRVSGTAVIFKALRCTLIFQKSQHGSTGRLTVLNDCLFIKRAVRNPAQNPTSLAITQNALYFSLCFFFMRYFVSDYFDV